jgi:hypothetical protein
LHDAYCVMQWVRFPDQFRETLCVAFRHNLRQATSMYQDLHFIEA